MACMQRIIEVVLLSAKSGPAVPLLLLISLVFFFTQAGELGYAAHLYLRRDASVTRAITTHACVPFTDSAAAPQHRQTISHT